MTFEVAHRSAASFTRDLLGAAPVAVLRAMAAALAVAALGQIPPSLVNVAGGGSRSPRSSGGLALHDGRDMRSRSSPRGPAGRWRTRQPASSASGSACSRSRRSPVACSWSVGRRRPGGSMTSARERVVVSASIAVPYAALMGIVNASVDLRLRTAGGFLRVDLDHGARHGRGS